jgi:hypothetical protein
MQTVTRSDEGVPQAAQATRRNEILLTRRSITGTIMEPAGRVPSPPPGLQLPLPHAVVLLPGPGSGLPSFWGGGLQSWLIFVNSTVVRFFRFVSNGLVRPPCVIMVPITKRYSAPT